MRTLTLRLRARWHCAGVVRSAYFLTRQSALMPEVILSHLPIHLYAATPHERSHQRNRAPHAAHSHFIALARADSAPHYSPRGQQNAAH